MRHRIITLLLGLAVLVTAGCGFHLRGTTQIPPELQKLQISTGDPYGEQTRAIRQQLLLNNVQIIESGDATLPVLKITSSSEVAGRLANACSTCLSTCCGLSVNSAWITRFAT